MKKHLLLFLLAVFSTIGFASAAEIEIVFKTGTLKDGTNSSSQTPSEYISEGASYISSVSTHTQTYVESIGGLKLGSSKNAGTIKLDLKTPVKATKIVVNASTYGSDTGQIKVNDGTAVNPATGLEFAVSDTQLSSIKIETTTKRAYIASIKIITDDEGGNTGGDGGDDPDPVNPPSGENMQITFKSGNGNSDQTNDIDTGTLSKFLTTGSNYISKAEAKKVYLGKSGYGLKFGTGKVDGELTLTLKDSYDITSVVVNGAAYNTSAANIDVNGVTNSVTSKDFADYTFKINEKTNTITIKSTGSSEHRAYIKGLTIYYNDGASELTDPQLIWADWTSGSAVSVTSLNLTVGETVSTPFPYSLAYNQEEATVVSSDEAVVTYDNGEIKAVGAGSATLTATTEANSTFKEGKAVLNVTVTAAPVKPGKPVFSVTNEIVEYNTPITVKAENAKSYTYTIKYTNDADKDLEDVIDEFEGDTWTYNITRDVKITIVATNGDFSSEEVTQNYAISTPDVITFTPAAGEVEAGTTVTFTADPEKPYDYYLMINSDDNISEETFKNVTSGSFVVTEDVEVLVNAILPNGYYGENNTASYTVAAPVKPGIPAPAISKASGTYPTGTPITVSCDIKGKRSYRIYINGVYQNTNGPLNDASRDAQNVDGDFTFILHGHYFVNDVCNIDVEVYNAEGFTTDEVSPKTSVTYNFCLPYTPKPYVNGVEIPNGATLEAGTEVTFKADYLSEIGYYEFDVAGGYAPCKWLDGNECTITIDKMHRRYTFYGYDGHALPDKAYSEGGFYMFDIAPEVTVVDNGTKWVRVTDVADLHDGDKVVLAISYSTKNAPTPVDYVIGTTGNSSNNAWAGVITTFNKPDNANEWNFTSLPEGAYELTLEGSASEGFKIKTGDKYFTSNSSANGLKLAEDGTVYHVKNFYEADYGGAMIEFYIGDQRAIRFNNPYFGFYKNSDPSSNRPIMVFKEVSDVTTIEVPVTYTLKVKYNEYTGEVAGMGGDEISTLSEEAPLSYEAEFTAADSEDTYTANLDADKHLCGRFVITVDNEELGGHKDNAVAVADLHNQYNADAATSGYDACEADHTDHAPYVYVNHQATEAYQLVVASNANYAPLSTNPDEYHGKLIHHQNAVMTLNFKPFYNAGLSLTSTTATGVDNVAVDAAQDADAVYYDMSGRRIQGNLLPGFYLEVRGTQARKVYVK